MLKPVPDIQPETAAERAQRLGEDVALAQQEVLRELLSDLTVIGQRCLAAGELDKTHTGVRGEVQWIGRDIARRMLTIESVRSGRR